jgi:hypothetical protein
MQPLPGLPAAGRKFRLAVQISAKQPPRERYTRRLLMKILIACMILVASVKALGAAPATRPAMDPLPTIEPTGPVKLARYVKPFAQAEPSRVNRDYAARYIYGTPFYYYGCGYYGGYCGWYGFGYCYCHPIYYPYGPYYPCY